ncbi:LPS translocon maturation chaperone LptM [Psychromonas sp. B3M02]|uniref:LPS translocon maturation chaperone LptM n=1 Tax=Psychromonas sp. B3M02 TaxID=2267226 RepID=UPI0015EFFA42|nr:lipoprotein [Psychromonas sp. B3M02]
MKNLYLSLIVLCFSSFLVGCGMKGPLYQEAPQQQETETQQNNVTDTTTDALNNSQ